jgi:hypothetical protein
LIHDIEGATPKKKIKLSTQMITKYEINDTAAQMVKSINQTAKISPKLASPALT